MAWLALFIVMLQFALVIGRYAFDFGSIRLSETVIYAHAALFLLAAAWTLQAGGHVRVDVFYAQARPRTRALVDLIGALMLLLPFALMLLWLSIPYAAHSWAILERSQESSGLPLVFVLKTLHSAVRAADGAARRGAGDGGKAWGAALHERSLSSSPFSMVAAVVRRADGRLSGRADARRRVAHLRRHSATSPARWDSPFSARCRSASSA